VSLVKRTTGISLVFAKRLICSTYAVPIFPRTAGDGIVPPGRGLRNRHQLTVALQPRDVARGGRSDRPSGPGPSRARRAGLRWWPRRYLQLPERLAKPHRGRQEGVRRLRSRSEGTLGPVARRDAYERSSYRIPAPPESPKRSAQPLGGMRLSG